MTRVQQIYWRITVSVSSCDEVLIDWLKDRYDGNAMRNMDRGPTRRLQHRWQVTGAKARLFLQQVEPYLVIKGERARKAEEVYVIQTEGRKDGAFYSAEQKQRLLDIREWFDNEKKLRSGAARGE